MVDTHTHIYEFADEDADETIERARQSGVTLVLLPNCDEKTLGQVTALRKRHPDFCRVMWGLHPTEIDTARPQEQLKNIIAYAASHAEGLVGVGEIGLDLYWTRDTLDIQIEVLRAQLDWALELNLPVSLHVRKAYQEFFQVLKDFPADRLRGSLHCFGGGIEEARYAIKNYPGLMFGFNGTLTYKNSRLPEVLRIVPRDRILIETDAPYLAPVPMRGKRNEPAYLTHVIGFMANVLGIEPDEADRLTTENALRLFALA